MTVFTKKAPGLMELLMRDFPIDLEESGAIVGNLGHESGGFKSMQEKNPTVKGSRGGWGWAQWTGPRRRAFEAYCSRNGLDPSGDKANYGWLWVELHGSEKHAIPAVKKAKGLRNKVIAFERAFERAGVKHYDSRERWAEMALQAYADAPKPVAPLFGAIDQPIPDDPGVEPKPPPLDLMSILIHIANRLRAVFSWRRR